MILVDTSVIIDKLNKVENEKTLLFDRRLAAQKPFGISVFTFHEILQGAKSETEFRKLYNYFSTQRIIALPNTVTAYAKSARQFFNLQRQGFMVRNTVDVLIAYTAIYYNIPLLHNDEDFDLIAEKLPKLRILS